MFYLLSCLICKNQEVFLRFRKNNELSKVVSDLQKDKENAENQKNRLSKALDEKEKEIEIMQYDLAR